jgi:SAM-dependent methyltransferase
MYYEKSAWFYDAIYTWKDYAKETDYLLSVIRQYKRTDTNTLLDVACGTGGHLTHLIPHFACEGLDLDTGMLAVAREKFPHITFHQGDMTDFHLGRKYAVIICMFSSIGYTHTTEKLNATIQHFVDHTEQGGIIIVEPWFSSELMKDGYLSMDVVNQSELKITRMNVTRIEGAIATLNFHYLVGKDGAITYFTEQHRLAMFTDAEYQHAFRAAGLQVIHDPQGVNGRGLYIGIKA